MNYLHKTMRTNPARGHRHFRAPSMMIYKAIRGMIPHKTSRGAEALKRLHVYDGCPPRYSRVKKMVIPDALRALVMKPSSKYIRLGDLASQMGWNYGPLIRRLERERLHYAKIWYHRKVRAMKKHQEGLKAFRHLIPKKKKKGVKKEEKKEEEKKEEKKEEGAEKKEEVKKDDKKKVIRKKKHTHRANRRRLHKLAVIRKVSMLEGAAKKKAELKKKKAAEEKKKQRAAAARKARNIRKQEKAKKAKEAKLAQAKKDAKKKAKKAAKVPKTEAPKVKA